ncbi:Uncharacterised protein [Chryseobacterium taklimakanense]|uniref:DUF6705 domain-containing protein n=1 Tax=Chryseobacterium taklimakanense TaxID=536441 RepID=A0A239WD17_9FLAO|nr:DUF6705 family protein [Chryseobacterium taklimakanense]SNV32292.1 Uncharacterised protein [Chryseobacterium taklimakanense]
MKNIITTIILFFSFSCSAQYGKEFDNGDNYLNNNLNKFVGTWKYSDANQSLTIILKKENIKLPIENDVRADAIIGFHKFVKNDNIIEDNTMYSNTNYSDKKGSIFDFGDDNNQETIEPSFYNLSKNKYVDVKIQYVDATHIKIISIKNTPGLKLKPFDPAIIYPQNIILTKQ